MSKKTKTLEQLLSNTDKEKFSLTEEDREWLNAKAVGREILDDDYMDMNTQIDGELFKRFLIHLPGQSFRFHKMENKAQSVEGHCQINFAN